MSHLLQMRGLKQTKSLLVLTLYVASFTDAWIETIISLPADVIDKVASFTDAWIETSFCAAMARF